MASEPDRPGPRSAGGPDHDADTAARPVLLVPGGVVIPLAEIEWRFGPSGGPGGQHANRAHTRAEARLDLARSPSLSDAQRRRLMARLGGEVRVVVDEERSQRRNRELAVQRLRARLAAALVVPRTRRPTKPGRAATQRRLEAKRRRGQIKQARRRPLDD